MTGLQKAWDFALGVVLIAATPIVAFSFLVFLFAKIPRVSESNDAFLVVVALSFFAYFGACSWRRKHRRLPMHVFTWEALVGTVAGLAFMAVHIFASATAALAD